MWGISITMCYFHRFIDDINYSLQDFLITFFELLAWIVLIIGAIDTFPQNKYSNKRVWFYYAIRMRKTKKEILSIFDISDGACRAMRSRVRASLGIEDEDMETFLQELH